MSTGRKTDFNEPERWRSREQQSSGRGLLGKIVEELGLRILSGHYPPDSPIPTEPELIAELEVSRTVLREAVKVLSAKGLIESKPRSGTRVRPRRYWSLLDPTVLRLYCEVVDYSEFAQSFQEIRKILEPGACALAAERHTTRQIKALEQAYRDMAEATDNKSWSAADLRFHESILEATCNPLMRPLGEIIRAALETLLFNSAQNAPNQLDSLRSHEAVLDAIRRRASREASEAMAVLLTHTGLSISKAPKTERRRR